jgi:hypothetical protein
MSAPVDEMFDLDIRLSTIGMPGVGESVRSPAMYSNNFVLCVTDSIKCSAYDCTTIDKTC